MNAAIADCVPTPLCARLPPPRVQSLATALPIGVYVWTVACSRLHILLASTHVTYIFPARKMGYDMIEYILLKQRSRYGRYLG